MKRRTHSKNFVRVARASFWDGSAALLFLVLLSSVLLAFSAFYPSSSDSVRMRAVDMLTPVVELVSAPVQNIVMTVRGVTGLSEMQAENAALRAENKRLREWFQVAQTLESENAALRDLLNVKVDESRHYVTARVLSDSGMTFVKSLVINAGAQDKVDRNNAVLSGSGLVGRVVEAGQHAARVLLVTDVNSRIPVLLEGMEQHAILAGVNKSSPVLDHLDGDMIIPEGTRVITSGFGGVFPAGLPVGKIKSTNQGYAVDLYADFGKTRFVRVVSEARDTNLKTSSEE